MGAVGAFLAIVAMPLFDKIHIDDPVGCIAVHGVGALWGELLGKISSTESKFILMHINTMRTIFFRNGGCRPVREGRHSAVSE